MLKAALRDDVPVSGRDVNGIHIPIAVTGIKADRDQRLGSRIPADGAGIGTVVFVIFRSLFPAAVGAHQLVLGVVIHNVDVLVRVLAGLNLRVIPPLARGRALGSREDAFDIVAALAGLNHQIAVNSHRALFVRLAAAVADGAGSAIGDGVRLHAGIPADYHGRAMAAVAETGVAAADARGVIAALGPDIAAADFHREAGGVAPFTRADACPLTIAGDSGDIAAGDGHLAVHGVFVLVSIAAADARGVIATRSIDGAAVDDDLAEAAGGTHIVVVVVLARADARAARTARRIDRAAIDGDLAKGAAGGPADARAAEAAAGSGDIAAIDDDVSAGIGAETTYGRALLVSGCVQISFSANRQCHAFFDPEPASDRHRAAFAQFKHAVAFNNRAEPYRGVFDNHKGAAPHVQKGIIVLFELCHTVRSIGRGLRR